MFLSGTSHFMKVCKKMSPLHKGEFHCIQQVNVNRQFTCEGATSGHVWQDAFTLVKLLQAF